jgi:NifU-like protein involved in Fe-S cluster formation
MTEAREQFLKDLGYPDKAIAYILTEKNVGEFDDPSVVVRHQGHCGDVLFLQLLVDTLTGVVQDVRYRLTGCAGLQAAAGAASDMIFGMRIEELASLEVQDIIAFLGGSFPEFKLDCVELTRDTLHKAAAEYTAAGK